MVRLVRALVVFAISLAALLGHGFALRVALLGALVLGGVSILGIAYLLAGACTAVLVVWWVLAMLSIVPRLSDISAHKTGESAQAQCQSAALFEQRLARFSGQRRADAIYELGKLQIVSPEEAACLLAPARAPGLQQPTPANAPQPSATGEATGG